MRITTIFTVVTMLTSISARAEGLIAQKALSLDMAMSIAQGALEKCRASNWKCGVAVLDASGAPLIMLHDDGAMLHRWDISRKKAYTALLYRRPSKEVVEGWSKKTLENIPLQEGTLPSPPVVGTIAMGGGLPILVGKDVIGAVAVRLA